MVDFLPGMSGYSFALLLELLLPARDVRLELGLHLGSVG